MGSETGPTKDGKEDGLDRLPDDYRVIENAPKGVAKHRLDALRRRLGISMRAMAALLRISERTLSRHDRDTSFKESISEHILQIERVVEIGEDVFEDPDRFSQWLKDSCEALGGKVPGKLLGSITGARLVRDELVRIDHGVPY